MSQRSLTSNAIPLLSKFTGIAKYTCEISKRDTPVNKHLAYLARS